MKDKKNNKIHSNILDSNETLIKKMDVSELSDVKNFIIEQHNNLEQKDFFIIEDIDTELPVIFDNGIVIGMTKNNKILGLQAIDFSKKKTVWH